MAFTERYANFDLSTGLNDGTSEANAWQTPAAVIASVQPGDRVNIKKQAVAYDLTASVDFTTSGTITAPIYYRGYGTTIGDGGTWDVLYNSGGIANLDFTGDYIYVEGVTFLPGASTNLHRFNLNGIGAWGIRCKVHITSQSDYTNLMFSNIICGNGVRARTTGANTFPNYWEGNRIERTGATSSNSHLVITDNFGKGAKFINNIFVGAGITGEEGLFIDRQSDGRTVVIEGNRFYNFNSGIYIEEQPNANREDVWIVKNIFATMAEYGVENFDVETGYVKLLLNLHYDCTSGLTSYADEANFFAPTSLTASPYTSATDLSLNDTVGGGAVARANGFQINEPVDWETMTIESTFEGSAGGGGLLIHPGMNGGLNG